MIAFLPLIGRFLLGNLKWLLIGAGVAVLVVAGLVMLDRLADARADAVHWRAETETWKRANEANLQALDRFKVEAARAEVVLRQEAAAARERVRVVTIIKKEVADAPETDNGPVAPVLGRALDRLRERQAPDGG